MTTITVHPNWIIDEVSPLVFGGFLEHLGRAVYGGVFDPSSSHADDEGFRRDVLTALGDLEMTVMRYPGGNFASGYHWRDGVGPEDSRPTVRELAWQSLESNRFGTNEFLSLCAKARWQPMLCANLGTGTPEEARDWVEYCNLDSGRWADLRAAHGIVTPRPVPYWCLGNEMDGPWQLGHVPAADYSIRARQAAKMMKDCDDRLETVACGSSGPDMNTFLEWDRVVLETLGEMADYVSLHRYVGNRDGDSQDYLGVGVSIDSQIEAVDSCARFVAARTKSRKRTYLCFDEWNVWYRSQDSDGRGQHAPKIMEEVYNLEDALVVASFLMSFIRHADSVKIANLAQIVNVIAPILTEGDTMVLQTSYHAFRMISQRKTGVALKASQRGPSVETSTYGDVPVIDSAVILDRDRSRLHLFAMNRDIDQASEIRLQMPGYSPVLESAEILHGELSATNTFSDPTRIRAEPFDGWAGNTVELPPHSFVVSTFALDGSSVNEE